MQPIFNTNQITLYQGDCLEIMPTLPDHSIDFILCDLPYSLTECKWDVLIPFEPLWEQYKRLIKPNGAIVLFGSQPFTSKLIMSNLEWFKYCWYWQKSNCTGFANAKKQPLRCIEEAVVFCKGQSKYFPQGVTKLDIPKIRSKDTGEFMGRTGFKDGYAQSNTNYPKNLLHFSNPFEDHPTQKPTPLLQYLIQTYTKEGEVVLDNTCGSGSTLVAARDTGRKAIGIEKDSKYCQIAIERCSQLSIFEQAV